MTANSYGLMIEGLVAVLLVLTISYCMVLNRRLSLLRRDESSFKGTIAELVSATESAERAIAGLKLTVRESEEILAARLRSSELICADLQRELKRGDVGRVITVPAVASIRAGTGLSQAKFASLLGVSVRTLQEWEQGRRAPTGAARTLLMVAAKNPQALLEIA